MLVSGAIFLVTFIVAAADGQSISALLMASLALACIPPAIVERWADVRIPVPLMLMYAGLLLSGPYLGTYLDFYGFWPPWDTAVHFISGFPIALGTVFAIGVSVHRYSLRLPPWMEAVMVFTAGVTVAVLWECAEFVSDIVVGTEAQYDNLDTMQDLIGGALSPAMVAAALVMHRLRGWFAALSPLLGGPEGRAR